MKRSLGLVLGGIALAGWGISRLVREEFSFERKVVLLTGGSRGLGLVLARQLCAKGARVVLLARDREELEHAQRDAAQEGGEAHIVVCDLTKRDQIEAAVRDVIARFDGVDVLINNAGIIEVGPLEHMQREDFERAMALHFWAPFDLVSGVIPQMKRRGGGRIVNITSIGGKIAVPHLAPYCASKFALVGFSDSIRAELARAGILVTTVAPGMMRTGSHVNAKFKGNHTAEFAWFSVGNAMPFVSAQAERAAAQILAACARGQSSLTITLAASAAIAGNALFPNLTGAAMKLANRLLPGASDATGDEIRSGWQSRGGSPVPAWVTRLSDAATERNGEARGGER